MAVIQISRIQVRRGLQENLPQLASGEMGWSIDARRLYIGNGTLAEGAPSTGNTEILTQYSDIASIIESYTFKGTESGYTSSTGPTANTYVSRSLLDKLDEQISFRDFITDADAESGIYTDALQRAIDEIFPSSQITNTAVRRILRIPAGNYEIDGVIYVPPYATIVGDGPESTIITQTSAASIFKFKDSLDQIDATYGLNSATLANNINISGMKLISESSNDIVYMNALNDVSFKEVYFVGVSSSPVIVGSGQSCVRIDNTFGTSIRVYFTQCKFSNATYGWNITGKVRHISAYNCNFDNLYQGIILAAAGGDNPTNIKSISSVFDNIAQQAVYSGDSAGFSGLFNYYGLVGQSDGLVMDAGTMTSSILSWANPNNFSIGEFHQRNSANLEVQSFVKITNTTIPSLFKVDTRGSIQDTPGFTETLPDATTSNTSYFLQAGKSSIIDYQIFRSNIGVRVGSIKVNNYSGSAIFEDDYSESVNIGVTLTFNAASGNSVVLGYTTTGTSESSTIKYQVRSFT